MTTDGRGEYGGGGDTRKVHRRRREVGGCGGRVGGRAMMSTTGCAGRLGPSPDQPARAPSYPQPPTHPPHVQVSKAAHPTAHPPHHAPPLILPRVVGLRAAFRRASERAEGGGGGGEAPLPGGGSPARLATAAGCLPQTQPAGAIPIGRVRGGEGMSRRGGCALAAVVSGSYGASAAVTRQAS